MFKAEDFDVEFEYIFYHDTAKRELFLQELADLANKKLKEKE